MRVSVLVLTEPVNLLTFSKNYIVYHKLIETSAQAVLQEHVIGEEVVENSEKA